MYNNEYVSGIDALELIIFDKNTGKKFFGINKRNKDIFPEDGYIINRKILINKEEALKFTDFYKINAKRLDELRPREDTIVLAPYDKFRIDTPSFLEKMREKPDTIQLLLNLTNGKQKEVEIPMNW